MSFSPELEKLEKALFPLGLNKVQEARLLAAAGAPRDPLGLAPWRMSPAKVLENLPKVKGIPPQGFLASFRWVLENRKNVGIPYSLVPPLEDRDLLSLMNSKFPEDVEMAVLVLEGRKRALAYLTPIPWRVPDPRL